MEGETSWLNNCYDDVARESSNFNSFSELSDEGNKDSNAISVDLFLPEDILERILSYLPIASIFRATSVCKRWHEIITSRQFLWNLSHIRSQKPWYFMFTNSDEPIGYAYDPFFRKWYPFDIPCITTSNLIIASSSGLVCFMDNHSKIDLRICNPITKLCRTLKVPESLRYSTYGTLAVSVNKISHVYTVSYVTSYEVMGSLFDWDLRIYTYNSESKYWVTSWREVLSGWRSEERSVICNGILYILICSVGTGGNQKGLIAYNLFTGSSHSSLIKSFIPVPCPLSSGRLINLNERLVMVGGIGRQDRADIIRGIKIWILRENEWVEVARMPHKYFQGFGEFDDVFGSGGAGDLIYIQSFGGSTLLVFDMNLRQWKWSLKCPVTKKFSLQLFTGFGFEPRLDVEP